MSLIRLQNVSKRFAQTAAVRNIDLSFPDSEITVLLGRSGCGKTTTLRLVAGLERADSGDIWIGDQHVSGNRVWLSATQRKLGMVFQDYAIFPHLTVAENVAFGLPRGRQSRQRTTDMLALVGLAGRKRSHGQYRHHLYERSW